MSGTELTSPQGLMEGSFTMAEVEKTTASARVGDALDAFDNDEQCFELKVAPFFLKS